MSCGCRVGGQVQHTHQSFVEGRVLDRLESLEQIGRDLVNHLDSFVQCKYGRFVDVICRDAIEMLLIGRHGLFPVCGERLPILGLLAIPPHRRHEGAYQHNESRNS